jgi:hypothetical protein
MPISIPVDFEGVPERGSIKVTPGDYLVKPIKVEKDKAKSSGNPMLIIRFEFIDGPEKGIKGRRGLLDRHILVTDSLWTLRNMLEAFGYQVPAGKMQFKDDMILNRPVGVTIVDSEEYNNRVKSEVADYFSPDAYGNISKSGEAEFPGDTDAGDDDDWGDDDDVEDEPVEDEPESDEDEDDGFSFEDDDEEEEEEAKEESFSFSKAEVENAKGADLKGYLKEAMAQGWEFDLSDKPKVSEVREVLLDLFDSEDDDEEMESFSLDDVE